MRFTVNGKQEEIQANRMLLTDLLRLKKVKHQEMVSVELNGSLLKQKDIPSTVVKDGDRLEFLYFIGGGDRGD